MGKTKRFTTSKIKQLLLMKKTTQVLGALALFLSVNITAFAQQTTDAALSEMQSKAKATEVKVGEAKQTLKTLLVAYFVTNNPTPNTNGFKTAINGQLQAIDQLAQAQYDALYKAEGFNGNLDVSNAEDFIQEIESASYQSKRKVTALVTAIQNNDKQTAQTVSTALKGQLEMIIQYSEEAFDEAENLKAVPEIFKVRILLVDERSGQSVPANTIRGYGATDTKSNKFYQTGERQGDPVNEFKALPAGTYRFDGMDGYFDGTGSKVVSLSNSMVQADGYIYITLTYWSE
ncbi:conserved exported hypothetical protein [Tenacibaculum litopenaei]